MRGSNADPTLPKLDDDMLVESVENPVTVPAGEIAPTKFA